MRKSVVLAAIVSVTTTSAASAMQSSDSELWAQHANTMSADSVPLDAEGTFRWRVTSQFADATRSVIIDETTQDTEFSAIASQVDFYPFGDEFFLSAGAVRNLDGAELPQWTQLDDSPAWAAFPHSQLTETTTTDRIDALTRYFGAGVTVRTIDAWSLTLEGGAYFRDRGEDRLEVAGFDSVESVQVLDDLDSVDRAAVGETNARSVKPVAHFVLRRRF